MPRQAATTGSLPQAFEVVEEMQADGPERGEGCRPLGRQAPAGIIDGRDHRVPYGRSGRRLARHPRRQRHARPAQRHLPSALGDIERDVPRTRHFCPTGVPKGSARRAPEIDRAILAGFVPGLSTRKVGEVLPGRPVSAATVSRVAGTLDRSVAAFHRRPLKNDCKAVMPDGVVLARKTGAGALGRPVLVAPGIRHDGRKEIVDFRRAGNESAAERERFLDRPYHRGLTGEGLEMTGVDGGKGLLAALPIVRHGIPVQRCRAHRIRNILDRVRGAHREAVMNADTRPEALAASPTTGRASAPGPSLPCATIPTICSPASAAGPLPGEGRSGPPMPANDGSARSADEPGPREPSGTGHRRTASSTRSSSTKAGLGESVPHSP